MIETYYLNQNTLPTIPTPHDCPIKRIETTKDFLILEFADDLTGYDSFPDKPNVKSLIIRIHLLDEDIEIYKNKYSFSKNKYIQIKNEQFVNLKNVEYLYHYVRYCSIIIQCISDDLYFLQIYADFIEYEWILKEE